ncbi:MAG: hypothetical protein HRU20_16345 [Pseudomonadales bacterium]|nr:hypothetical protein [Pseudomonadales bacterium]
MNSSFTKIFSTYIVSTLLLIACSDDRDSNSAKDQAAECTENNTLNRKVIRSTVSGFGDGTDGEFYLDVGEEFLLEEKIYNFTNVYTNKGSSIRLKNTSQNKDAIIEINSVGNCEFLGDIILPQFLGTLRLKCYSVISFNGNIDVSNGDLEIETPSIVIITPDELTKVYRGSTISNSVVIGEISTFSVSPNSANEVTIELKPGSVDGDSVELIPGSFDGDTVEFNHDSMVTGCSNEI